MAQELKRLDNYRWEVKGEQKVKGAESDSLVPRSPNTWKGASPGQTLPRRYRGDLFVRIIPRLFPVNAVLDSINAM